MIMGLIRFLLIVGIAYYLIKWISRLFQPAPHGPRNRGSDNVTLHYDREKSRSRTPKDAGEYVDYEEIE